MEISKLGKCPNCESENVFDTGNKEGLAEEFEKNGSYTQPNIPIYECKNCKNYFTL